MKVKKLIEAFACGLAILSLAATTACQRSVETDHAPTDDNPTARTILFRAGEVMTKTAFGEKEGTSYPTLWTDNDATIKLALNFSEADVVSVIPDEGYRTATFQADIDATGLEAPYTFYAVSPASAATALSPSREAWNVSIPCVQTPLEGSVDEAAQILAAASAPSTTLPGEVDIHFNHLTAYGRISFKNLNLGDAQVQAVEMTATTPFVGDWYWNCNEGHALTDNGASSTLTLNTSRTTDLWFACAPVDMSGEIMVITVYTDQGALVKEVEFPANRKFTSGRIAAFTVNMDGIELQSQSDSFVLVTDASVLKAGDEVIIANQDGDYALGEQVTNNNRAYRAVAAVTVVDGVMTQTGNASILTLHNGNASGYWAFQAEEGYLSTSSTRNCMTTTSSIWGTSSWELSIRNNGDATIKAKEGSYPYIRYNEKDARFSAYGENSSLKDPVAIYRRASDQSVPVAADPLTEEEDQYGCYLSRSWVYTPGEDQFVRSYDATGVETFTLLAPNQLEQLEIKGYRKSLVKGDPVTIEVFWRMGLVRYFTGERYDMTVVKEEGPKVWLGDGSGQGFIIKK